MKSICGGLGNREGAKLVMESGAGGADEMLSVHFQNILAYPYQSVKWLYTYSDIQRENNHPIYLELLPVSFKNV